LCVLKNATRPCVTPGTEKTKIRQKIEKPAMKIGHAMHFCQIEKRSRPILEELIYDEVAHFEIVNVTFFRTVVLARVIAVLSV
jgi:hypothetical protein